MNELLQNLKEKVMSSIDDTFSSIFYTVLDDDEYLAEDIKYSFNALLDEVASIFEAVKTPND